MQSQYFHELDHWRSTSQRPQPSRSLDRSTPSPTIHPSSRSHHNRTQSATSPDQDFSDTKMKPSYFDRNGGGWLESNPVQLTSSISSPSFPQTNSSDNGHTKEMLGAVSNEDILKLTQLTNELPVLSRKHNHIQKTHKHHRNRSSMENDVRPAAPELVQPQPHKSHISNDSRITDTGFTDLLNQDFMKPSTSDTENSALLTIPSNNPSTISTDTDDSQLSWKNNQRTKQPSTQATHPLSISTSTPDVIMPMETNNNNNNNRRSWYKSLMKRDKKGKNRYDDHPLNPTGESTPETDYEIDDESNEHYTLQHQPTLVDSNYGYNNIRNNTHPIVDNTMIPSNRKRPVHSHLSIKRLRFPSRHRRSSSAYRNDHSVYKTNNNHSDSYQNELHSRTMSNRGDRKLRLPFYGRRHSFDNMREYVHVDGTPTSTTDSRLSADKQESHHIRTTPSSINMDHQDDTPAASASNSSPLLTPSVTVPYTMSPSWPITTIPPISAVTSLHNTSPAQSTPDTDDITSSTRGATQFHDIPDSPILIEKDNNNHQRSMNDNISPIQQQDIGQQQQHSKQIFYFDYHSLPKDSENGEPKGIKGLVKMMIDNGYGTLKERRIKPANEDENHEEDDDDDDDNDDEDMETDNDGDEDNDKDDDNDNAGKSSKNESSSSLSPILSSKVITGDIWNDPSSTKSRTRQIAEIHVDTENDVGFVKFTQLPDETSHCKGRLLNLYVSFLSTNKTDDRFVMSVRDNEDLSKTVSDRLLSLDPFIDEAKAFLRERKQQYRAFVPMDDLQQQQRRGSRKGSDSDTSGVRFTNGDASSRSSSSSSLLTPTTTQQRLDSTSSSTTPIRPASLSSSHRSLSSSLQLSQHSLWNYVPYQEYNAYEYRQDQLKVAVADLRRGMDDIKRSLESTEGMIRGVQIDMNDTKAKMDTYLKDVPETHYSELKRLEVSIESILANRAKSRGMELLYWLLTALLTGKKKKRKKKRRILTVIVLGCAFLIWAVICILKLGQTAISFPRKMIKAFNEHMAERNEVVKQAGMRIVAKGADRPPSLPSSSRTSMVPTSSSSSSMIDNTVHSTSNRRRSSSSQRISAPK
ncbi:uncharacterized protein BX664DRAFT_344205 [Halteromyces radiatus]|uniref:uncharacterized protein n=1 Tax=Halteromyces radiatus TaxID=101107 RepID=UPI00222056AE|nr:uncharacterized protein BX664DRAFT_344205 [Halteromyces radiatus]KAI8076899.1 hypothetical protein BX664DRAFT_344205 [Halteromyces radiatus]